MDNILSDYNLAEALAAKKEGPERTFEEQSIHELLAKYADIIYTDVKSWLRPTSFNIPYTYLIQPQSCKNVG